MCLCGVDGWMGGWVGGRMGGWMGSRPIMKGVNASVLIDEKHHASLPFIFRPYIAY